jgi:hypothetical protein
MRYLIFSPRHSGFWSGEHDLQLLRPMTLFL